MLKRLTGWLETDEVTDRKGEAGGLKVFEVIGWKG